MLTILLFSSGLVAGAGTLYLGKKWNIVKSYKIYKGNKKLEDENRDDLDSSAFSRKSNKKRDISIRMSTTETMGTEDLPTSTIENGSTPANQISDSSFKEAQRAKIEKLDEDKDSHNHDTPTGVLESDVSDVEEDSHYVKRPSDSELEKFIREKRDSDSNSVSESSNKQISKSESKNLNENKSKELKDENSEGSESSPMKTGDDEGDNSNKNIDAVVPDEYNELKTGEKEEENSDSDEEFLESTATGVLPQTDEIIEFIRGDMKDNEQGNHTVQVQNLDSGVLKKSNKEDETSGETVDAAGSVESDETPSLTGILEAPRDKSDEDLKRADTIEEKSRVEDEDATATGVLPDEDTLEETLEKVKEVDYSETSAANIESVDVFAWGYLGAFKHIRDQIRFADGKQPKNYKD